MSDIEYYTYYGKIKGINTSDGMLNLLVTLSDSNDINVKTEEYEKNSIAPPRGKYLEQGKSLHSKLPMRY